MLRLHSGPRRRRREARQNATRCAWQDWATRPTAGGPAKSHIRRCIERAAPTRAPIRRRLRNPKQTLKSKTLGAGRGPTEFFPDTADRWSAKQWTPTHPMLPPWPSNPHAPGPGRKTLEAETLGAGRAPTEFFSGRPASGVGETLDSRSVQMFPRAPEAQAPCLCHARR